ncbi:hypothetical protein Sjap_005709 [Stephania japonica]|uniref:Uncharacterized protein n=1 Tax=Stephania japonica TaxID=461633 RepID=A0AAP0K4S3_9MAGN
MITKKQLEELLSNKVSVEQVMMLGFQKERSYAEEGEVDKEADHESSRGNWRPKLETIPE